MRTIWANAALTGPLWRVTYKTLSLLDYLIRHGSDRAIDEARDHLREIKRLQRFEYVDPDGKDCGGNVREKAKQLVELLDQKNEGELSEAREKAKGLANKYKGVSASDMGFAGGDGDKKGFGSDDSKKGFSDDDFKFASDRGKLGASNLRVTDHCTHTAATLTTYASPLSTGKLGGATSAAAGVLGGVGSVLGGFAASAAEYAQAANKQLQSMQTLFPSNELEKKLTDATSNEPQMPSAVLLYDLGRATHRDDDYRIILSAVWQVHVTPLPASHVPRPHI